MVTRPDFGSKKRIRTGVAISQTSLCAADIRLHGVGDRAWRASLEPPADSGPWPSLAAALSDLARSLGITEGTLAVSLMPPFTEVRRLELPPLRDEELQRILSRDASKYFVGARTPQIVGASPVGRRGRGAGGRVPVIATASSARLLAAIRGAADAAGWTIEVIAPAEAAWAAAAVAAWPTMGRQQAFAIVAHEDRTDLLQIDDGKLVGVRRFRAGGGDAPMIVDTMGPSARVGLLGSPGPRRQLSAALSAHGVSTAPLSSEWSDAAERPDVLAAQFAGSEIGPALRSEAAVAFERARTRRATGTVAGIAAAFLVVAAGIELWGLHHQLALVRAERARIKPQIASTMVGRTTVDAAYRHLTTLTTIDRTAPHWSFVIATLTDAVPDDAYLTGIRTRQDSVIVDGLADHAARVFDALEQSEGLIEVKAAAPVRRELPSGGGDALEHFMIAARVAPSSAKLVPMPASNAGGGKRPGGESGGDPAAGNGGRDAGAAAAGAPRR